MQPAPRRGVTITVKKRKQPDVSAPADVSTPETPTKIPRHIQAVMVSKNAHNGASLISEVLRVGEKYDVIDIQEITTRYGPKLIWTFKGVEDTSLKKVFGCADLQRYITGSVGHLDSGMRAEMIKHVRVVYKGFQTPEEGWWCAHPKYVFEFLQKKRKK